MADALLRFSLLLPSSSRTPLLASFSSNSAQFKRFGSSTTASETFAVVFSPKTKKRLITAHAVVAEDDGPKWWEKTTDNMIDVHSTEEFLQALNQAEDRLVIVEFYGTWCGSCRALFPKGKWLQDFVALFTLPTIFWVLPKFQDRFAVFFPSICKTAEEHPDILFVKVNFDENKPMCKRLNVRVLPYFHFYRGADGQLESFSCSLAKFQKIKDAIAVHNTARCSIGPPLGVGDIDLFAGPYPKNKPAQTTR